MKLILLAATAMIAAPVMAQTTPAPAPADQTMTPAPADPAAAPADAQTPPPPPAAPAPQASMPPRRDHRLARRRLCADRPGRDRRYAGFDPAPGLPSGADPGSGLPAAPGEGKLPDLQEGSV